MSWKYGMTSVPMNPLYNRQGSNPLISRTPGGAAPLVSDTAKRPFQSLPGGYRGRGAGEKHAPTIKAFNAGGGMSDSENRMVNHKGRIIGNMGSPKSTTDGKDTSKNAKNKISGPAGLLTKEQSPSACSHSRNQYGKRHK